MKKNRPATVQNANEPMTDAPELWKSGVVPMLVLCNSFVFVSAALDCCLESQTKFRAGLTITGYLASFPHSTCAKQLGY